MKIIADQNIPYVKECFSSIGDVTLTGGRDVTPELVKDADILLVRSITKVNADLLAGSSVKFVATATIGTEHVNQGYLDEHGIGFASAPGSNANSVAEYIVAALLTLGKKHSFRLEGKSIGIVGVGNVGSKVETKCRALGMDVVLNDPPLARQTGGLEEKVAAASRELAGAEAEERERRGELRSARAALLQLVPAENRDDL